MYGSGHNAGWCKFASLREHVREIRAHATRQREFCAEQRTRLKLSRESLVQTESREAATGTPSITRGEISSAAPAVVAIVASAGGLTPLTRILSAFPADLPAAVIVSVHTSAGSALPACLRSRCRLPVNFAETGTTVSKGNVYVARPLKHLIINADRTLTVAEPRRGFAKPSADWLFDTLAPTYGDGAIAIVLSGYQRDGARGVVRIRDAGGHVIVQEPGSCEARDMPDAAISTGCVRRVLPAELIAAAVIDHLKTLDLDSARRAFENPFAA
jgi:two-component system, chemotaxis family, protein-glutamate methylesterase/glutaminase